MRLRLKAAFVLSTFLHVFSKLKVTLLGTGNSGDKVLQHSKYFKQDQLNKRKMNTLGDTMKLAIIFFFYLTQAQRQATTTEHPGSAQTGTDC